MRENRSTDRRAAWIHAGRQNANV